MQNVYINNTNLVRQIKENNYDWDKDKKILMYEAFVGKSQGNDVYVTAFIKRKSKAKPKEDVFKPFDFVVLDAVYALYQENYREFTLRDILRVITCDDRTTLTPKRKDTIIESIERMKKSEISIYAKKETDMRKINYEKVEHLYKKYQKFLPIIQKGNTENNIRYEFETEAQIPLYEYANIVNHQIICVPKELFTCKESPAIQTDANATDTGDKKKRQKKKAISDTADIILMKRYIVSRIENIRNSRSKINKPQILYGNGNNRGMLAKIGITRENQSEAVYINHKNRIHNKVIALLDYYKQIGYIKSYTLIQQKYGYINGVKIEGEIQDPNCLIRK